MVFYFIIVTGPLNKYFEQGKCEVKKIKGRTLCDHLRLPNIQNPTTHKIIINTQPILPLYFTVIKLKDKYLLNQ